MKATFRALLLAAAGAVALSVSAVAQTPAEAARILSISADGEPLLSLGSSAYERGNYSDALEYFQILAEKGIANGQFNLSIMYYQGKGVPQSYPEAVRLYRLAAAQGHSNAAGNRDLVRGDMTPAQVAEGQKLAAEWKPKE